MHKQSILIVDDEQGLLETLSHLLQREFHVYTASNGREGLHTFKANPSISLILLDLEMPVMNGLEMLKRLRKMDNNVKVMIMTGKSCHEWAKKCANLHVHGYIEKAFAPKELIGMIKKILGIEEFEILKELWNENYKTRIALISPLVKKAIKYIQRNCGKFFTRCEIAANLNITPEHLSYIFHKECCIQLRDYINIHRIYTSRQYLTKHDNMKIKEVAVLVGIPDSSYFSKLFKKYTGLTPQQFKKETCIS